MLRRLSSPLSYIFDGKGSSTGDEAVDNLIRVCDLMIRELNEIAPRETSVFNPFSQILKSAKKITENRRNSKGSAQKQDPSEIYKILSPKVQVIESELRSKLAELTEKKSALRDQARHLQDRLDSCILFNIGQLQKVEVYINECKEILEKLECEHIYVTKMLAFNSELCQQIAGTKNGGNKSSFFSYG